MKHLSPDPTSRRLQVLVACLLAFSILIMPIAAVAAPSIARETAAKKIETDKKNKTEKAKSAAEELFVNPPTAPATETSAALPGPIPAPAPEPFAPPVVGSVTATMTAALTATANNGDGKADPGDTINYTVQLGNTSGSDATGLSFNPTLDSHTTFVPGSIKSTPICFDQSGITLNEDASTPITLTGQDPDGDSLTFSIVTPPANGGFGVTTAPNLTYTPNANFFGADSFTFRVNDGTTSGAGNNGNSNETCTVSITVNAVNDAPTFTAPGNPAAVNEDAGAQNVLFITPASIRPAQSGNTTEDAQTVSFVITNNTNPSLFSSAPAINVNAGAYPRTANLTFTPAANQNGTATITYHAHDDGGTANGGVDNSGDQTFTITVNAVNDPPVVVGPAAFAAQANMKRTGLTGLLANVNDNADNGVNGCVSTTFTVTNVSATSPAGGTISNLNASTGTFDFDPPPGVTGAVTFTYTVTDTGCPGPGVASAPVTVTFNVAAPVIWFVNLGAGVNGDGRLSSPFNSLASANTKLQSLATNQRIFLYTTGATPASAAVGDIVTLQGAGTQAAAHWLIGQGAIDAGGFDTLMGISPPANTIARPSINGVRPIVRGTVTMKDNTVVQGLNIDVSAGATKGLTGSGLGAGSVLTIKDVNVTSASGNAVDFSSAQTISYTTSNASTSPNILVSTTGIACSVVNTTIGASGMTFKSISANGAASGIVLTSTGSGAFTVNGDGALATAGDAPQTAGLLKRNGSGGTINLTTGDAVKLTSANNVTLRQMNITNPGFDGVESTGSSNIILSALEINHPGNANPASDGSTGNPAGFGGGNGWYADNVTGINSFDNNSRVINWQSSQSNAVLLRQTNTNFTSFTVDNAFISTSATGAAGLHVNANGTTTGTVNLTDTELTLIDQNAAQILNNGSGTITSVVQRNNFHDADFTATDGNNTLFIAQTGSGTSNFTVGGPNAADGNIFKNLARFVAATGVIAVNCTTTSQVGSKLSGSVQNNNISNDAGFVNGRRAIDISMEANGGSQGGNSVLVANNTINNVAAQGINITWVSVAGGDLLNNNFTVKNNTLTNVGTLGNVDSGSGIELESNIDAANTGADLSANILVQGNSVQNSNNSAVGTTFEVNNRNTGGTNTSALNLTVLGNTFTNSNAGGEVVEILNSAGDGTGAAGLTTCLDLNSGNTSPNNAVGGNGTGFKLTNNKGTFSIEGMGASTPSAFLGPKNQSNGVSPATITAAGASAFTTSAGCANSTASLGSETRGPEQLARTDNLFLDAYPRLSFLSLNRYFAPGLEKLNRAPESAPTVMAANQAPSSLMVAGGGFARGQKAAAKMQAPSRGKQETRVESRSEVGSQKSAVRDQKSEARGQRSAVSSQKSDVRLNHAKSVKTGVRGQGSGVRHSSPLASRAFAPVPVGGTFPINGTGAGFSLPNGKTITIKFSVTLNNPPNLSGVPPATPQVSAQGTLSGAFPGNPIVTDDPGTVALNDATVTLVDLFDTTTTLGAVPAAGSWNVGQSITFTATVASNPPGNPTAVTGSVVFKDNGTPIAGCNGVALSSAQAQCVTTFSSGAHSVTAVYSGDGNFDPSTSSALSQGAVNQSGTSTAVTSSLNPSLVTENVTFTATVTSTSGFTGPPTGTVQFKDNLVDLGSPQTLNGSGVATLMTSALAAGNHPITAVYSGDTNFTTSTGTLTGDPQVVNKSNTSTLLTSSSNPVAPTVEVTYTATVSSSTSVTGPPTGTVTFNDGVNPIACTNAGGQTLSGGVATCKFTYPDAVGSPHDISAVYGGDATFNGNTSNHVSEVIQTCSASVVVTSNADSGANTLRDAIDTGVCAGGTITFDPSVTSITLVTQLTIAKNMTITGPGSGTLTISGNNVTRVFNVNSGQTAAVSGMTITGGKVVGTAGTPGSPGGIGGSASGGGILNAGTLTLTSVIVSGSQATGGAGGAGAAGQAGGAGGDAFGGGIMNSGTLTLNNSTVNGSNSATGGKGGDSDTTNGNGGAAFGGGIYNTGTLTLTNSTISGNTVAGGAAGSGTGAAGTAGAGSGGGVYHDATASPATLTITGSTISGNTASTNGGGIANVGALTNATLTITNTTISGNGANNDGGGIYNAGATGTSTLTSVTLTGNNTDNDNNASGAGGGINVTSGTVTLRNTIVAGNLKGSSILQVETATVAGTITADGNAKVVVTADGMSNSPKTVSVAVLNTDTADVVAGKMRAALTADTDVNGFFTVSGATDKIILTARTVAANDATLNIATDNDTSTGLTASPTSANTTPGRTAHDIFGTVDATSSYNLIGDAASSGGLVEPNANHNLVGVVGAGIRHITTILNSTLADNGGPTKTHALVTGSAALEKGNAFGLTTDQRGFPRPVNFDATPPVAPFDDTDIGAFESQIAPAAPGAPNLDAVSDSGANSADDKTNVTTNLSFTIPGVVAGATVQLFRDGSPVASGVAAGASIQLVDPGPLTFDADGTTYSYTAKQSFGSDTSVASTALPVLITIVPDAPVLDPASDSGTLGDGITNDTSPTFNITNVVNGATVELLRDGAPIGGGVTGVAAGTTIQLTDPSASNGTFTYTARQTFSAVTSDPSSGTSITITIKPDAPDLDAGSDTGTSTTDNYTADSSPTFNITGVINGATVDLLRDTNPTSGPSAVVASGVAAGTTISLTDPGPVASGNYTYRVRQTVGITLSPDSDPLNVTIDTVNNPPSTPDLDTASDSNITTDNVTNDNTPTFSGTAEANSTVRLFANAVLKGTTTADNAGAWSITSSTLADNSYSITADSTDIAGTTSSVSGALNPVVIDTGLPSVTMTSATGNPTATTPIPVTVTFNEPVTGFVIGDIVTGNGTAGNFAGGPSVYTFDLTPTSPGPVSADIAAGVAIDLAGNTNTVATQFNRTFDPSALSATITPVAPDPRNTSVSSIQIVFNKAVTGFDLSDLTLKLNGGANLLTGAQTLTSGDNITWTLGNLSGITGAAGTYVLKLTASGSGIQDAATNPLTSDATESWVTDTTAPDVTINQAAGQADPVTGTTAGTVINFTAIFSEPVVAGSFTNADVTITGTAGATVVNITEIAPFDGTHFNVAVEGMTQSGTVIADIAAGVAQDAAGNGNTIGTFTDHTVTFNKDDFTTLEVNSVADTDDGFCTALGAGPGNQDCTLREAINAANADAGAETITFNSTVFAAPGPYTINLGSVLPDLSTDMTISGPGAKVLTVKRNVAGQFRIFLVNSSATVSISGLTVTNGLVTDGGGIKIGTGSLTLTRVAITGNTANAVGGGGGIVVAGASTLNVIESTINGNHATAASAIGGGIFNNGGTLTVVNSTISGNDVTQGQGGGIFGTGPGSTTISSSTITGNTAQSGGGIRVTSGHPATIKNTIIGANTATVTGPDMSNGGSSGTFNSDGFNLIKSTTDATITANPGAGPDITGVDPQLFALADNGGPTQTHALQCTSPAIDKGKAFGLTTDQRGGTRPFDLADGIYPNAAGGDGSDIGAVEVQTGGGCQPVAVPPNPQPSTNEDTAVLITLTGTYSQNFALTFTITQTPANGSLGAISAPVCNFNLSETCTATVNYTPNANFNGLDAFKFKVSAGGLDSDEAEVDVTVISVNDPPVANADALSNIAEDSGVRTIPFTDLLGNDSPGPANESGQTLTVISVSNPVGGTVSISSPNVLFTPTANYFGPASFQYKIRDNGTTNGAPDPKDSVAAAIVNFTIDPVADTPSVTNATTNEDTQTTSGLVISRNAADSGEVTHFKITAITNGTLFQNNGTTQINNGDFITFAQGNAGLKFTPDANLFSPTTTFSFQVQASLSNTDAGLGGGLATATITVNPVADLPSVTSATTDVNIQTTSGLVISRNPVDSAEVTHFKITNITNGTLFKNDGVTPIANNQFITFAEGNAGLKFTPANNLSSPGSTFSFDVQGATSAGGAGLSVAATASITVNCGSTIVTNSNDSGAGSLRAIILSACPGSTITFDMTPGHVTSPITLTSGQLLIDKNLRLLGPGANLLTISGNNTFRLINASFANVDLALNGLSFTGGGLQGGANATVVEFNNAGTLTLTNSEFFGNSGAPAASVIFGSLSTRITVDGSTFRGNTANGVIRSDRTPLRIVNSTISGNSGAGIDNGAAGSTITNATIADNDTGIASSSLVCGGCAASVTVTNTLLSSNASFNLRLGGAGTITSGGHNLIDDATAGAFTAPDPTSITIPAGTARIAPLANNGGSTQTRALLAGSPAFDAGDNAAVTNPPFSLVPPFTDQRGPGFIRLIDGPDADTTATVDIGAFEAQISVEDIPDKATNEDTQLQFTFNVGGAAAVTSVTATSSNTALVPNNVANLGLTSGGSTLTLTINPAADQFGTSTITITVNGVNSQSMTDTFVLTVNSVNDAPSFTKGADQSVSEDAGAQTVAGWATNISVGPPNEAGQTLAFQVTGNTNPGLFSVAPAVSPTGTLTYTPAANINGSAIITMVLKDSGGTANGGVDTSAPQSFTITVNSVNDAPSFTKGPDQTVNEDAGAQSIANWATNISPGPANESGQTVAFQVTGNTNPGLFSAGPAISPTGTLTYTPATNANGSATITIVLKDNGGTANGGQDTSAPQTFTITINAVNDAPVNHVPGAQNIPLNALFVFSTGTGNAISVTDVDAGSDALQVTIKATDGTITLNGTAGLSFTVGDGTDDPLMTFTGSLASINAALEGMKNLAFGSGVITITTNDLGHNGAGGALSDTDTIAVTVADNLAPLILTIPGTDKAIAFDSTSFVIDPFNLQGNSNFVADHRTHIMILALHAQLRPGETFTAVTAEADVAGTVVPLIVESVNTVPNFDWLTQIVIKFPDGFSTGGGGPHDAKIRITLRGQGSNQAVIIVVPAPKP